MLALGEETRKIAERTVEGFLHEDASPQGQGGTTVRGGTLAAEMWMTPHRPAQTPWQGEGEVNEGGAPGKEVAQRVLHGGGKEKGGGRPREYQ